MSDPAFPLPGVTSITTITQWEDFFHPAFGSGVVPGQGSEMVPSLDSSGRNVVLATGAAIVRAFYKPITALTYTSIPAPSAQNRIDRLVLRLDRSAVTADAFVQPVVIEGTPGSSPAVPAVTQTPTGLWDLPVAHWTSGSDGSLTNLVDEREMVSSPLVVMPSTAGLPSLDRAGLLIQPDTEQLLFSIAAGSPWRPVFQDDSWHSGGAGANGWNAGPFGFPASYFQYKFTGNGGMVAVEFRLVPPTGTSGMANGTQVLNNPLPAAYRPGGTGKKILAYTDFSRILPGTPYGNNEQACLEINTDGTVACHGFASMATLCEGTGLYPVDSPY